VKQADMLLASPASSRRRMDARLEKLDLDALGRSRIKAPALLWTELAGDGAVWESIPAFFKWEDPFAYPYLGRVRFLEDLTKRPQEDEILFTVPCERALRLKICYYMVHARLHVVLTSSYFFFNSAKRR
jgi:hypothetical protein